jgi:hypothetical protein
MHFRMQCLSPYDDGCDWPKLVRTLFYYRKTSVQVLCLRYRKERLRTVSVKFHSQLQSFIAFVTHIISPTHTGYEEFFWDVTSCSSWKNRRFGGTQRIQHQGDKNR